jgi:hypothetical protein
MILFFVFTAFTACQNDDEVTLDNIRTALINAGYRIVAELRDTEHAPAPENFVSGFVFILPGEHGDIDTPVFEFQDNNSANVYAQYINTYENWVAIVNNTFLTIAHIHHGIILDNERIFLENLINGKLLPHNE